MTFWSRCSTQRQDGSFCDAESLPDAPFPICVSHAAQLYGFLHGRVQEAGRTVMVDASTVQALLELNGSVLATPDTGAPPEWTVYYVRVGAYIKIGTTTQLEERLRAYPPDSELLATEPGGVEIERSRCRTHNSYLSAGREWFAPGSRLVEHINCLRAQAGQSLIDT